MSLYVSDVAEIERRLGGNKAAPIVLHCNGPFCGKSKRLSEELLAAAINLPLADVKKAKDDGRLPMEDHNTRIVVFGKDSLQARTVADAITKEAFHNVAYFVGTYETLKSVLK